MRDWFEKSALSRRSVLISAVGSTSLLAGTTRWAEAGTKVPQSAVHYQQTAKDGQDCDDCAHFMAPQACKLVDGTISPTGWCRLWVKKPA
jgi:hypothetical protein